MAPGPEVAGAGSGGGGSGPCDGDGSVSRSHISIACLDDKGRQPAGPRHSTSAHSLSGHRRCCPGGGRGRDVRRWPGRFTFLEPLPLNPPCRCRCSVTKSCPAPGDSTHARLPGPSASPGLRPDSCPWSAMPSNHLSLRILLLLLPFVFPSIGVFSSVFISD